MENSRRQTQPSVSIEQAARPKFDITVGDPHKVGDITSSHIVYQVRTKVSDELFKASLSVFDVANVIDYFKSIQTTRICCKPSLQRFPMALQFIA